MGDARLPGGWARKSLTKYCTWYIVNGWLPHEEPVVLCPSMTCILLQGVGNIGHELGQISSAMGAQAGKMEDGVGEEQ
ncbi:uncharacterized protein ColSpa_06253 [Colletotrichum spaethianum]|uniref:Uncharacterized protein n=1 Tax=Colletotrichum spaethianum TaxID=700344 RepID=A0AA37NYB8_9PEZI|nr:uncharacterized protein ColSpa_06253 [Colletotrichum spaethianum]GKT46072.1 hypothetical protein ColSpa_06253 [Colletotrichum spaethianum]